MKPVHHPNTNISIDHPAASDFDNIRDSKPGDWKFYGGRTVMKKRKTTWFPQRVPIVDTTPIDIRDRQVSEIQKSAVLPCWWEKKGDKGHKDCFLNHCAGKRKGGPNLSPKNALPPNKGALATA